MAKPPKQETAVVVTKTYGVVLWVLNKVEHFPRALRLSLGAADGCGAGSAGDAGVDGLHDGRGGAGNHAWSEAANLAGLEESQDGASHASG